jgi:hypothetical protein
MYVGTHGFDEIATRVFGSPQALYRVRDTQRLVDFIGRLDNEIISLNTTLDAATNTLCQLADQMQVHANKGLDLN